MAKDFSLAALLSSEAAKRRFEDACRAEAEKPWTPVPENERMIWPVDDCDIPDDLKPMTFAESEAQIPKEYLEMTEDELVEFFIRVADGEIDPSGNPVEPRQDEEQSKKRGKDVDKGKGEGRP